MAGLEDQPLLSPSHTLLVDAREEVDKLHELRRQQQDGTEDVYEVSVPSFNFQGRGLSRLPEELVDIIKDEAERLALNNNELTSLSGLAPRFSEFTRLRYLTLRNNKLQDFPIAVLECSHIEYLDLKRNKIEVLPDDLSRLRNLKGFSIEGNRVKRLPVSIAYMQSLTKFTTRRNPIEFPSRSLWRVESRISDPADEENYTRDVVETENLKKVLLAHVNQDKLTTDGEQSETTVETPRPARRRENGARFPIKPSVSSISMDGSPTPQSPAPSKASIASARLQAKLPPTPRTGPARPSVEPLSDRHRSNSESQMSTSVRQKRMGIQMSRGGKSSVELDNDPLGTDTNPSHSRGSSHGPALQTTTSAGAESSTSPDSPTRSEPRSASSGLRLSSLPEIKKKPPQYEPFIELAQGIVFSMEQIERPIKSLVSSTKASGVKRRSLERSCHIAFSSSAELSHILARVEALDEEGEGNDQFKVDKFKPAMDLQSHCESSVASFERLLETLQRDIATIVQHSNPRYIRLLMHTLFASVTEIRNSYTKFIGQHADADLTPMSGAPPQRALPARPSPSPRPTTSLRVRDRGRPSVGSRQMSMSKPLPSPGLAMTNGTAMSAQSAGMRSASTGPQQNFYNPLTPSLTPSHSFLYTPSTDGHEDREDDQIFEAIFKKLLVACDSTLHAIPLCSDVIYESKRRLMASRYGSVQDQPADLLLQQCMGVNEAAQELKDRLKDMKVREPGARDQLDFWQLCTTFTRTYSDFARNIRNQAGSGIVTDDLKLLLKPVQRSVKAASAAIDASPWRAHATHPPSSGQPSRTTSHQYLSSLGLQTRGYYPPDVNDPQSATSLRSGQSSGYVTPLPATPLSAALGPAVQATITNGVAAGLRDSAAIAGVAQMPGWYSSTAGIERSASVSRAASLSRSVSRSVSQRR